MAETLFDEEKENYGDVFTREDWVNLCRVGAFVPSDGCGYWGTETHYSYDFDCFGEEPEGATHVHWFNK